MSDEMRWLQREWAGRLAAAVESMTGATAIAEPAGGAGVSVEQDALYLCQPAAIGANAQIWICVPHATWQAIGGKVLQSAGIEVSSDEESRGTCIEVLQQSLSPLAQSIGAKLQRETEFSQGSVESTAPAGLEWVQVRVSVDGRQLPPAAFAITAELDKALAGPRADVGSTDALTGGVVSVLAKSPARGSKTMDLLLEVELPVGVSFGRVRMKLRDAVKLTTGSIVELNRRVTEPVEVIVNNCVIARGEVVVVEGNYGVRIQEIVSREERLRTLF